MGKERRGDLAGPPEGLTHNPLAKLLAGLRPAAAERAEGAAPRAAPQAAGAPAPAAALAAQPGTRVVVQVERKGHGGKTVTRALGLAGDLAGAARELARALGTGARAEDDGIVVQGEHVERLAAWLEARGTGGVVRGNR